MNPRSFVHEQGGYRQGGYGSDSGSGASCSTRQEQRQRLLQRREGHMQGIGAGLAGRTVTPKGVSMLLEMMCAMLTLYPPEDDGGSGRATGGSVTAVGSGGDSGGGGWGEGGRQFLYLAAHREKLLRVMPPLLGPPMLVSE